MYKKASIFSARHPKVTQLLIFKTSKIMNNHKLNILFVIRSNRTRIDGKTPLLCRLTYKKIRKIFATTVLLYNNVPMEIVSELLGHSKMSIT